MSSQKATAFSAIRWATISSFVRASLQVIQVAVLARILVPADFGLMALASSIMAIAAVFSDLGIGKSLFHKQNISLEILSSLYWVNMLASLLLMVSLWVLAWPLEILSGEPLIKHLLWICSLVFPLGSMGNIFRVLAEKQLAFAVLTRNELLSAVLGFVAAIAVSLAGGGVFALLASLLVNSLSHALLSCLSLPTRFSPSNRLRLKDVRTYLGVGGYAVGDGLVNMLRMQTDVLLGGILLGAGTLGFYSVPRNLCLRIGMVINPIITRVGLPVMARANTDRALLREVYLKTLRMTAAVNTPLYFVLAVFSEEIVLLLFGPQWADASPVFRILAFWGLLRSTGNPVGSLIYALGCTRRSFWWNIALLVTIPPVLWCGVFLGGIHGLSWAMLGCQIAVFFPVWRWLVHPLCGASLRDYLAQLILPLWMTMLATAIAYWGSRWADPAWLKLGVGVILFAPVYLVLSWYFNRSWCKAMLELANPFRKFSRS